MTKLNINAASLQKPVSIVDKFEVKIYPDELEKNKQVNDSAFYQNRPLI